MRFNPFTPLNSPFKWFLTFLLSLLIHYILYSLYGFSNIKVEHPSPQAVMVEFSDPPQSILIEHSLPIGVLQSQSQASEAVSPPKEEDPNELPQVEQHTPTPDPEIKASTAQRKVKPKELQKFAKKVPLVTPQKRQITQKVNEVRPQSSNQSVNNPQTTAPPKLTGNKVAAEFNSSGNNQSVLLNWKAKVQTLLEKNLRYPMQALNKGWEGKAVVKAIINQTGKVVNVQLVSSSGRTILDNEALNLMQRVSLPAPPPEWLNQNQIISTFPIVFDYAKEQKR